MQFLRNSYSTPKVCRPSHARGNCRGGDEELKRCGVRAGSRLLLSISAGTRMATWDALTPIKTRLTHPALPKFASQNSDLAFHASAKMPYSHHSHSGQFCKHAKGTLEEVVQEAIRQGFEIYGLTEHVPRYRTQDLYPEEVRVDLISIGSFHPYLSL